MKCLWFFLVLICIASCRHRHKDVVEEQEDGFDYPLNQGFDQKFPDEQWIDMDTKDGDLPPELKELLFWNFHAGADTNLKSENNNKNPDYDYNYSVGEEFDGNDFPLVWPEDDELFLFKESPSLNSEKENSDKESEEYINDDWLYNFDYIVNKLNKQKEEDNNSNNNNNNNNKYVNMDKLQLPLFKTDEENNDKFSKEKVNDDILFPLVNENDYFLDKLSEEKKDKLSEEKKDADSLDIEDKMDAILLPYLKFDQENKTPTEEKENGDWFLFPSVNDYDSSGKMSQDKKDLETLNKDAHIKITLLRNTDNKLTLRIVSIDDNDRVVNPEMEDANNGLEWDSFSERKYFDNYDMNNDNPGDRFLARRYISRSRMFMTSIVIVVFSITLFGFCLLCKIFNPKRRANKLCNKDSGYQQLNEEIA